MPSGAGLGGSNVPPRAAGPGSPATLFQDLQALTRSLLFERWDHLLAFLLQGREIATPPDASEYFNMRTAEHYQRRMWSFTMLSRFTPPMACTIRMLMEARRRLVACSGGVEIPATRCFLGVEDREARQETSLEARILRRQLPGGAVEPASSARLLAEAFPSQVWLKKQT